MLDFLLIVIAMLSSALAAPVDEINGIARNADVNAPLTTGAGVVGALAILIGLFLVLAGVRLFKLALFAGGFLLFSNLTALVLVKLAPAEGFSDMVLLLVPIGVGILGGLIAYKVWRFGVSLIGGLGGAFVALLILGSTNGGLFQSELTRYIFIAIFAAIGAFAIHWFEKPVLVLSTSLVGGYLIMFGIDVFVKTGFTNAAMAFLFKNADGQDIVYTASGSVIAMMAGVVVLTVGGCIYQYRSNEGKVYREGI
jgi:hypothetical protein